MPDTQRTTATIFSLLANNTAGAISPQDLRDALLSWRNGHGQIYVPAAAAAAITIANTNDYVEATTPAWTLSSGAHLFDESGGNGRLTYTGVEPMVAHIACSISMTCGSNLQLTHWRLGVNATPDAASECQRKIGTGTDSGSTALHLIATVTNGDYISLWCRNSTSAADVTLEVANLQAVTMII
jgi:hypothetical protein